MDSLANYGSDEEEAPSCIPSTAVVHRIVNAAPVVLAAKKATSIQVLGHNQTQLLSNPTIDVVTAPIQGPAHPFKFMSQFGGSNNSRGVGQIETTNIEDWAFNDQFQNYQRSGYAIDSSSGEVMGDYIEYLNTDMENKRKAPVSKDKEKGNSGKKRKGLVPDQIGDFDSGPWAPHVSDDAEVVTLSNSKIEVAKDEEKEEAIGTNDMLKFTTNQ